MTEEGLGKLLSDAKSFFFDNLKFLSKYALIVALLIFVSQVIAVVLFLISIMGSAEVISLTAGLKAAALGILVGMIFGVIVAVVNLTITIRIYHRLIGEEKTFKESFDILKKRLGALVITSIIGTIFLLGLYLLIIPGIIFSVYWIFAAYSVLFREKKGKKALNYSKSLVSGNWGRVFVYMLVVTIIVVVASLAFGLLLLIPNLISGPVDSEQILKFTGEITFKDNILPLFFDLVNNFFRTLIGYFSVIFSLGLFLSLEKQKGFHESKLAEHSPEEGVIKDYIEKYMKKYPKEEIKTALLKSGYSEKLVDKELSEHYS